MFYKPFITFGAKKSGKNNNNTNEYNRVPTFFVGPNNITINYNRVPMFYVGITKYSCKQP